MYARMRARAGRRGLRDRSGSWGPGNDWEKARDKVKRLVEHKEGSGRATWRGGRRRVLAGFAAAFAVALAAGCAGGGEAAEMGGQRPGGPGGPGFMDGARAIPVSAQVAATGALQVTLRGSTNLRARERVDVVPKQSGVISRIAVEEGARVREGDLLAQLEDEEWRLQVVQARARAQAAADAAQRGRALAEQDLVSAQEVERLVSDSAVAAAELGLAELRVRNAQIRSPIAGVVTHRYVDRGAQVGPNTSLFSVADVDRLEADVAVPEREAYRVRVGQDARIVIDEAGPPIATGRVERIRPVVDPGSGTVQVTISVAARDDARLRSGQFVNVDIVTEVLEDRITLPRTSVLVDGAAPRVYVVRGDRAEEREVALGYSRGDQVEIRSGVAPGDTVVIVGQDNLRPDARVRLMQVDGMTVMAGAER